MGKERELEAQVRELTERLSHADKLACLGQMSAGIAHEINNPVAYVLANLTALSDLLDDLETSQLSEAASQALTGAREIVEDCAGGMERIRRISADLKKFARVEESTYTRVDVNAVVESACQLADHEVRHRARLVVSLGKIPPVMGDPGKLTQVVLNLLINAAQAIDGGDASHHRVRVETLCEEDRVIIRVSDTGRGISEQHRARIFEPFFTTKHDGGTGLGLWLVQDLVRRHDGDISVSSVEGKGATFDVRLKAHDGSTRSMRPEAVHHSPDTASMPLPRRARVLLIDDDAALRRALKRMLSAHHEVIEGDGGEGGLRALAHGQRYDAILCDLMMPDVDGVAVYDHLAQHRPELLPRLAFLSGGAFTPRTRTFLDQVAHQVVEKPVSREALLRVIAGLVQQDDDEPLQVVGASK
jgi:nitrogen-specific signal transduction histidine kinase/ActR/RegA family two-component response regulator